MSTESSTNTISPLDEAVEAMVCTCCPLLIGGQLQVRGFDNQVAKAYIRATLNTMTQLGMPASYGIGAKNS